MAPKCKRQRRYVCSWALILGTVFLLSSTISARLSAADPPDGAAQRTAQLITGDSFAAQLVGADDQWNVSFRAGDAERRVPVDQLVSWGAYRDRGRGTHLLLTDGSILVVELVAMTGESVRIVGDFWSELEISLRHVRGIVLRAPQDLLRRDKLFDRIQQSQGSEDRVLLENDDELTGLLSGTSQPTDHPGLELQIRLRSGEQPVPIDLRRVRAIVFNPALLQPVKPPPRIVQVGLRDGSRLLTTAIDSVGNGLQLTLVCGRKLDMEPGILSNAPQWDAFEQVRLLRGSVTYVSDLPDLQYKQVPWLQLTWPFGRDRNVRGGWLRHEGSVVSKGLGMCSRSRLACEVPEGARWFAAELAIDELAGRQGSVQFRVYRQDDAGWSVDYQSPVVRGGEPPVPIKLDVSGAKRLALIVDFAERGSQLDLANWLNARFVK